jgi:hypothetical protein
LKENYRNLDYFYRAANLESANKLKGKSKEILIMNISENYDDSQE